MSSSASADRDSLRSLSCGCFARYMFDYIQSYFFTDDNFIAVLQGRREFLFLFCDCIFYAFFKRIIFSNMQVLLHIYVDLSFFILSRTQSSARYQETTRVWFTIEKSS
jgi:hypothetical protein